VAYAFGLQRMTGTKTDDKGRTLVRATACFRRGDSRWRITHIHNSVAFAMDGSEKLHSRGGYAQRAVRQ
jgi:ketosteroid isomerase-like protein